MNKRCLKSDVADNQIDTSMINIELTRSNVLASRLETLPNELFLIIFSYSHSDIIIRAFLGLNQRFQSLLRRYVRHLVVTNTLTSNWLHQYMSSMSNDIETIKLDIKHLPSVFACQYSYPNLRSILIYFNFAWQVDLNVENEIPANAVVSSMTLLRKYSFGGIDDDYSKLLLPTPTTQTIDDAQSNKNLVNAKSNCTDPIFPCATLRRVWIFRYNQENLYGLQALAPNLIYLNVQYRYTDAYGFNPHSPPAQIRMISPANLIELCIKMIGFRSFTGIEQLIKCYRSSLKRLTLDLSHGLLIDGEQFESSLASCVHLQEFSFINQCYNKGANISNLVHSFQSKWWLDSRRSPVLIHHTECDRILIASMPCSFSSFLRHFPFSSELHRWHLNKDQLNSSVVHFPKANYLHISSKFPISCKFLQLVAHMFRSRKLPIECNYWALTFEEELLQQFLEKSIVQAILPNITQLIITQTKRLSLFALIAWLLVAPNVRMLRIGYRTFDETMEWVTELYETMMVNDDRLKMVLQKIRIISVSSISYDCAPRLQHRLCSLLGKLFPSAFIH